MIFVLLLILEWDLRPEFNLGFPELNPGYSLREVTTQDVLALKIFHSRFFKVLYHQCGRF